MGEDGAVGGRVRDAGEDEALLHLLVVEEGLVGLVDGALLRERSGADASVSRGCIAAGEKGGARRQAVAPRPCPRKRSKRPRGKSTGGRVQPPAQR